MATSIIETSERPQTGMEIEKTLHQEEFPATETTGMTFTDEQRKILAQTYRIILSWGKPNPQLTAAVSADSASNLAVETEA